MVDVVRLPAQHTKRPHCEACGRELVDFDKLTVLEQPDLATAKILMVTLHVLCACGKRWGIEKDMDPP